MSRSVAQAATQGENGSVEMRMRIPAIAVALLVSCVAGSAQNNSDRDTNGASKTSATAPPAEARIDINHASVDQLMKAPGMTRTWAARIVKYRPYRTKQDLLEYGIVTSEVYDHIKDYVIAHRDEQ
jgi:DNA uptake protein ComE-like DNA-binding protein